MAIRTPVTNGVWTTLDAITKDTAYGIEGGSVRLQTGASAPTSILDGIEWAPGEKVVIAGGKTVYATAASNSGIVVRMEIGA